MSIRTRLLLSYIAMVLIPVILFMIIAHLLAGFFFNDLAGNRDVNENDTDRGGAYAFWETFDDRDELFAGMKYMARYDPDRLANSDFLKKTDEEFQQLQTGFVVVKNNRVLFASPLVDNADLQDQLQSVDTDQDSRWGERINNRFTVERHEFTFSDHSSGTMYFLSDMKPIFEGMRLLFPALFLALLVIIGLTNGVLTYLVSRSIIKPLYELKHAAEQIKEGNLDHRIKLGRKDEIGQLGAAFEEMRERLQQSIRLQLQYEENRKELISSISHDLKTPITGIKACIEGIRDRVADTEEKRDKYMQMIDKKAADMDRLIDDLFLFSKLDLKRLPFHFENMDIVAYLRDFAEELRADPRKKEVSVEFEYDDKKPVVVMADREKLHRVIMNIVDNSMKYMRKGQMEIRMKLFKGKEEAVISVQDNGAGIEKEKLPHIFDRFYRVEPSRNTLTGGSGLGLAIVKQIVKEHGGRTWAKSEIGEGTTIFFTLPLQKTGMSGGEPS